MAFGMSMKHSIVFLDRGTLRAELRAPEFPHSYQEYAATPAPLAAERLRDATWEAALGQLFVLRLLGRPVLGALSP